MTPWTPGKHGSQDYGESLEVACDVAIIGAGAGGIAMATALAERGLQVALFEAGRHWNNRDFQTTNSFAFRHLYAERGNRVAMGNGWIPINGGRGVGGSTLINSAISFVTPPEILSGWRDRYDWDPKGGFEGHLERVMQVLQVGVNPLAVQGRNNTIFDQGMRALGWEGGAYMPRSAPGCTGCGVCQLGCPSGGKWSADRSFLPIGMTTGKIGVFADCRAETVSTEGGRVQGVQGQILDPVSQLAIGSWSVQAKAVVLACGSIESPRFLMRNGLSESEHVGHHLRMHPATGIFARFDELIQHWQGVSQGYWVDRWSDGYLIETATLTPDANFIAMPLELGEELNTVMADLQHLALAGVMIHDTDTVARVTQDSVFFEFGDQDRQTMLRGLRTVARVFFAAGADYLVLPVVGAGLLKREQDIESVLALDIPFSRLLTASSHPMGTCRLGKSASTSVLDPQGRVWGWENLYVADASTFPEALGVNPQVTVMAMGLHVSETVAQDLG